MVADGTPIPKGRVNEASGTKVMALSFTELLGESWQQGKLVCVGLDADWPKLPAVLRGHDSQPGDAILEFNRHIIDATADIALAYKPNSAFYEAHGADGIRALVETIAYVRLKAPSTAVILDAKRADIGNTNDGYVRFAFDVCEADAVTVNPYLGREALAPFLERTDKGILVLVRTSNPGAPEFQDEVVTGGRRLYEVVAEHVAKSWNSNGNCGVVAGAPYPGEMRRIREIVGDMPVLIPGIGTQGGAVASTVHAARDSHGRGMIINSSRGIIYASAGDDFADAARRAALDLQEEIRVALLADDA